MKTTPVITLSNWSYPTAANCCVFPAWMEAVDGDAWIEVKTEGGRLTVRVIVLLWNALSRCADLRSAHGNAAGESVGTHGGDAQGWS